MSPEIFLLQPTLGYLVLLLDLGLGIHWKHQERLLSFWFSYLCLLKIAHRLVWNVYLSIHSLDIFLFEIASSNKSLTDTKAIRPETKLWVFQWEIDSEISTSAWHRGDKQDSIWGSLGARIKFLAYYRCVDLFKGECLNHKGIWG